MSETEARPFPEPDPSRPWWRDGLPGPDGRVAIENVWPLVDGGRFAVKRELNDTLSVTCTAFQDTPEFLGGVLQVRPEGGEWRESPLEPGPDARFSGTSVPLDGLGRWEYRLAFWVDRWSTWLRDAAKRLDAGKLETLDILEGLELVEQAAGRAPNGHRAFLSDQAREIRAAFEASGDADQALRALSAPDLAPVVGHYPDRALESHSPAYPVVVDRVLARFAAWYELFPRSYGPNGRHGTFRDVIAQLPRLERLGFDVLYLTPIHPIGTTNRKGRNNSLVAAPGDPGSPYGIGSPEGGHTALHPQLGSFEDLEALRQAAEAHGLELAMDVAIQASPDHPWVKEHPGFFHHRPDGSIRYAENPPKRYEDIYPINFFGTESDALWLELEETFEFWIGKGIKTFRVDNPHTKPFHFWEWLIGRVKDRHPEVIFLAEAFTVPRTMKRLAKVGFTQSYTYFTWRNTPWELREYLTELTKSEMREYYRPNFYANTHDILHDYLVHGGLPAFKVRLIYAATLSSVYGIYSGFEIGDNEPFPGKEEYNNNEKYQFRRYDFDAPGNLNDLIARVNAIRRENEALHETNNVEFTDVTNANILAYTKVTGFNRLLVVVNNDPHNVQEGLVRVPWWDLGLPGDRPYTARDLLTGRTYTWQGERNYVRLDPQGIPAHILRLEAD
ncbi:MAG TPA: alpha-1,4-glucan--maltose-1-phosphate maltosyltransferase [Deinococcales bacterium]|nr:alpha-1,4-glucan--maltose-1-phosphate maltosyltransferase [Deinococcales bacterium]